MQKKYQVNEKLVGIRLDKALSLVDEYSRSFIQTNLENNNITVNGKIVKPSYKLELNDEIVFEVPEEKKLTLEPKNMDLDIIYEDDDLAIINKPKGMVVHPSNGHYDDTLVSGLLHSLKNLSSINGVIRPGIVHRIDKDTSGLLVVAKNDYAHEQLQLQLKDHSLSRIYYALVIGEITEEYGRINAPIGRDPKDRIKQAVVADGKPATTNFKVLERFSGYTLVECRLETGRTHQIRVHMAYIKHPILGDPLYGPRKVYGTIGQYLHAKEIGFIHPTTKKYMHFETKLPQYFEDILNDLRNEKK